jgi:hypothetical protein
MRISNKVKHVKERWFAWYPVITIDTNETAWFEYVYRYYNGITEHGSTWWCFATEEGMNRCLDKFKK